MGNMVPLRSSRNRPHGSHENPQGRSRTGQIDHDVFEGLPVRRWARQHATVSQASKSESLEGGLLASQKLPELRMPKDSHLLAPMSRALLRAARAGCTYIQPDSKRPGEGGAAGEAAGGGGVGDAEKEVGKAAGGGAKHVPVYERTYVASKWGAIPRNAEPPEMEFLAKRRPGLPSLHGVPVLAGGSTEDMTGQLQAQATPMRKTKFRKTDASTGSVTIYEVWVLSGYKLEDEVKDDDDLKAEDDDSAAVIASPAPGTVIEGVGVADQNGVVIVDQDANIIAPMQKNQPPGPKRKAKGQGKGKRKKVMFAPGEGAAVVPPEDVPVTQSAEGDDGPKEGEERTLDVEQVKSEQAEGSAAEIGYPEPSVASEVQHEEVQAVTESAESEQVPHRETPAPSDTQGQSTSQEPPQTAPDMATDLPTADVENLPTTSIQREPENEPHETTQEDQPGITVSVHPKDDEMDVDPNPVAQEQPEHEVAPDQAAQNHQSPIHRPPVGESVDTNLPASPPGASTTTADITSETTTTAPETAAETTIPITTTTEDPSITTTTSTAEANVPQTNPTPDPESHQVHFEDGEVDLLGSLEASLDRKQADQQQTVQQTAEESASHTEPPAVDQAQPPTTESNDNPQPPEGDENTRS